MTISENGMDQVRAALLKVVREVALDARSGSVRDTGRQPPFVKPEVVAAAGGHAAVVAAINAHPDLVRLAPADASAPRKWITGFEPDVVIARLINGALWERALDGDLSETAVARALDGELIALRRLVVERKANARVWVGFGAELPASVSISTEWGDLRPWRETDALLFRDVADHVPARGCVLEMIDEMELNVLPDDEPGSIQIAGLDAERCQRVAVAFLLAQTADDAKPTQPWAVVQGQVLGPGTNGGSSRQFRQGPSFAPEDLANLSAWLDRVANPRLSMIAIARLTSMVQRFDNVDSFIDAVIVWENLFGTGDNQELSYRVSTNMACVLSDAPAERVALQSELKKLYNLRSSVVHGGKHLTPWEAQATRHRAQVLTIHATQRLLGQHDELLGASANDFMALVLGAAPADGTVTRPAEPGVGQSG